MKRSWFGAGLLAILLALGLLTTWGMARCHDPISRDLEQAAQAALSEDWDRAAALAEQAGDRWQACWRLSAAVADHEPMEEIDSLFAQLEVYQQVRDSRAVASLCAELSQRVGNMLEAHQCSWWNLL